MSLTQSSECIIWGGNYFAADLGDWTGPLVWDKATGNNTYADGELAWTNCVKTLRIYRHQWCGAFKDSERGQVNVHPTQKPIAVMVWSISHTKASVILDPFCGSGTTLVAAKKLGRRYIGIDICEKYVAIAKNRLRDTERPLFPMTDTPEDAE